MRKKHPEISAVNHRSDAFVFRVLSYNIHSCVNADKQVRPEKVAEIINGLNVDIIALQEVDAEKPLSQNKNQARTISQIMNLDYVYFPLEEEGLRAFGLALLTRFPLVDFKSDRLPNLYPKLNPRKRGAIRATLKTPTGTIQLVNTHLSLFKMERRRQVTRLLPSSGMPAVREKEPVILCGDLNAGPLSETYRKLSRDLIDVQKALENVRQPEPTFHSRSPIFRIDHIFISAHFTPLNVDVVRTWDTEMASDHLSLVAELALNKTTIKQIVLG